MDELTMVRELAPPVEPPSVAVLQATRAALVDAAREQRVPPAVTPPRARWTRGRVLTAVGAAAAVAAVAVAVLAAPTARLGDRAPAARANASEVLLQAATVARNSPDVVPRADQFVYVDSSGTRSWLSVDGTQDGLILGDDGARTSLPGCRGGVTEVGGNYQGTRPQPCTPMPAYQPDLPTDADAMFTYLAGDLPTGGAVDPAAVNRVGKQIEYLLSSTYLGSAQRAALFEAVTRVPGLQVAEDATGPGGDRGTAVSWEGPAAGDNDVLLFDPITHLLDSFYTRAPNGTLGGGTVGVPQVVDQVGQVP